MKNKNCMWHIAHIAGLLCLIYTPTAHAVPSPFSIEPTDLQEARRRLRPTPPPQTPQAKQSSLFEEIKKKAEEIKARIPSKISQLEEDQEQKTEIARRESYQAEQRKKKEEQEARKKKWDLAIQSIADRNNKDWLQTALDATALYEQADEATKKQWRQELSKASRDRLKSELKKAADNKKQARAA